jgi:SAM-dependent methyltransferase
MPKTAAFDAHSNAYDDWFETHDRLYQAELDAIRQLIPSHAVEGMEVGVGSGKFAAPLGITIGVEPSEQMAVKARLQGIDVYPGVAEALPFADERFDLVLMVTTICFVDDILKSFDEAHRVLKPGGSIIVGFVDKESDLGREYWDRRAESAFYREATFFSTLEVIGYLKEAGFHISRIKQTLLPGQQPKGVLDGFGRGSFVAIEGLKPGD